MKAKFAVAVAAAALLVSGAAQASADLAEKSGCNKCHAVDTKKMGASYKDIAKKYKGNAAAEADLVKKLATGTGHPKATASEADLTGIVKWILAM
jgi:cytochrome c